MILGFLSDAHGNPDGLSRCLRALRGANVERLYFLGDAVGYLPFENEVLALLESSGAIPIRGNHEAMLLGAMELPEARDRVYRLAEARARLEPRWRAWIETWPETRALVIDGLRFLLVHGSPADPLGGYVYPDTDLAPFRELPYEVVLLGQTHRPFVSRADEVTVINIGSSGMPRDIGNLASCAVYDTTSRTAEVLRVPFDAEALAARVGGSVDPSVIALFARVQEGPPVGRVVDVRDDADAC
jgi:predicted phosphodiesterase